MRNGLYIVSTPIGNLGDISARAVDTLKGCDIIICENPKHSLKILSKLDIKKKLLSLHDYNEKDLINKIKDQLDNKIFSLISDAGSPLISDPGFKLVRFCLKNNIFVTVIPGASSLTSALQLSSIPINKYIFHGFLPKSKKTIIDLTKELDIEELTTVFFVSSHKILFFLETLATTLADRNIAICKEITKINEKIFMGLPGEVLTSFKKDKKNTLGEFVVVIEGNNNLKNPKDILNIETKQILRQLLGKFSLTDTVEIVHKMGNIGKKEIYKEALKIKNEK